MGDPEMPFLDGLLSKKKDVDVDVAGSLGNFPRTAQRGFDIQAGGQQFLGRLVSLHLADQVQEEALVHSSHGFGLVHRRTENRVHAPFIQLVQGAGQEVLAAAQIGPEREQDRGLGWRSRQKTLRGCLMVPMVPIPLR